MKRKLCLSALIGNTEMRFLSLKLPYEKLVLQWVDRREITLKKKKKKKIGVNIPEPHISSLTKAIPTLAFLSSLKLKTVMFPEKEISKGTGTQRQFTF